MLDVPDRHHAPEADIPSKVTQYTTHLKDIERVFNEHALELGLGVRLDSSGAIAAVKHGAGIARVMRFATAATIPGSFTIHN